MRTIDRLTFLRLGATWLVGSLAIACDRFDLTVSLLARVLDIVAFLPVEELQRIGEAYRAMVPREGTAAALKQSLELRDVRNLIGLPEAPLRRRIRAEFQAERIVIVDGWVLTATEARACALLSLVPESR